MTVAARNIDADEVVSSTLIFAAFRLRRRNKLWELLPWAAAIGFYIFFPDHLLLGTTVIIMIMLGLSVDLMFGYAGIMTLGHAAFFGAGAYTVGILAVRGWVDPLVGLATAGVVGVALGVIVGVIASRLRGLSLLVVTLCIASMIEEVANKVPSLTGGADGLQFPPIGPILGIFEFDFFGRVGFIYTVGVLFCVTLAVRTIVHSPFGRSLVAIRDHESRMRALGAPVRRRLLTAFAIGGCIAAIAGALLAQTTQFISLAVLGFATSSNALLFPMIGGFGRLYGAFIGSPIYNIAQSVFARHEPVYWLFWLGLMLIILVMFGSGGVLGLVDRIRARRHGGQRHD